MTLQSSGAISLDQIRTEYGISGAVSMNQLYRNGSYVDNTKEVTDAISSVSDSGFPWMGYSNDRYNYGNLNTWSGSVPAGGTKVYGYTINSQAVTSAIASYISSSGQYLDPPSNDDTIFSWSFNSVTTKSASVTLTFNNARLGTYYAWGHCLDNFSTMAISGAASGNISATTLPTTHAKIATIVVDSSNKVVTFTMNCPGQRIYADVFLNTTDALNDKTILVNQSVPTSSAIDFQDFYNGENA